MKPTEVMKEEHDGIKVMLSILEEICKKLDGNHHVDPAHLSDIVEFFKNFADKCHHGKEEDLLFTELQNYDLGEAKELVDELLKEHEQGREYVRNMSGGVDVYRGAGGEKPTGFIEQGRKYVEFLREHIRKEDDILWPVVDAKLGEEAQAKLVDEFEKFEVEKIGAGKHDEYHELIHTFEKIYLGHSDHHHHHHHQDHDH
jgi:hemerythrin-like domain-containing protein